VLEAEFLQETFYNVPDELKAIPIYNISLIFSCFRNCQRLLYKGRAQFSLSLTIFGGEGT
jgi:hypothetical protein